MSLFCATSICVKAIGTERTTYSIRPCRKNGANGVSKLPALASDALTYFSADGTVAPNDSADVSFDTDGIISRIPVEVGDDVKVGDVLAYVSNGTAQAELKSAMASLKAAKANREAVEEETDDDGDSADNTQMTDEERDLEQAAAATQGQTLSEFVRQAARREAEQVLAERTSIALNPEEATRFLAALDDPSSFETGLDALTERPSVLGG